jgi:hypothetical protein
MARSAGYGPHPVIFYENKTRDAGVSVSRYCLPLDLVFKNPAFSSLFPVN